MLEVIGILFLSSTYSGIFDGTKMLEDLQSGLGNLCGRFGRVPVTMGLGTGLAAVFCNQTISTMMCCDLMKTYLFRRWRRQRGTGYRFRKLSDSYRLFHTMDHWIQRAPVLYGCGGLFYDLCLFHVFNPDLLSLHQKENEESG